VTEKKCSSLGHGRGNDKSAWIANADITKQARHQLDLIILTQGKRINQNLDAATPETESHIVPSAGSVASVFDAIMLSFSPISGAASGARGCGQGGSLLEVLG
jgi:hypothetical protein